MYYVNWGALLALVIAFSFLGWLAYVSFRYGDPPDTAAERCECDAFNSAVNDEVIYLDPTSGDEAAAWRIASNSLDLVLDMQINFCPFCGFLVPT